MTLFFSGNNVGKDGAVVVDKGMADGQKVTFSREGDQEPDEEKEGTFLNDKNQAKYHDNFMISIMKYSRKSRLWQLFLDLAIYILIRTSLRPNTYLIQVTFKTPSSHTQGILNSFSSHPHVTLKSS